MSTRSFEIQATSSFLGTHVLNAGEMAEWDDEFQLETESLALVIHDHGNDEACVITGTHAELVAVVDRLVSALDPPF